MAQLKSCVPAQNGYKVPFWRRPGVILLLIVLLAAFLRLVNLGQSPPGLNQDGAANAWTAYCLLKTGKDQAGVSWPIFYTRQLGSNNATLYVYAMIPFLAVGGLSVVTARLLSAFSGILCVPLIYYVGWRLFDRRVGLLAALLLALNPWHLHISRWAIESGICPILGIAPLAVMLWAKMPISDNNRESPRPLLAALAGALLGVCCYGYWPIRLFIPAFLGLVIVVNLPAWWRCVKTRKGAFAIAAFIVTLGAVAGPLAWQHIFHPEGIGRHGLYQMPLLGSDPVFVLLKNIILRHLQHFDPRFLFVRGDLSQTRTAPGVGQFHWYMLPLMITGLIMLFKKFKSSRSARVLLVFVIIYPVGDSLYRTMDDINSLRSSPGICSLVLLAAVGGMCMVRWLWKQDRPKALAATAIFAAAVIGLNARYLYHFYGEYNRRPAIYHSYHSDLVEACKWLRPRFDEFDAIYCTTQGMNHPYIITLVALGYEPERWFSEPRDITTPGEFDFYTRYGKMHFLYERLDYFTHYAKEYLMYERSFIPDLSELRQSAGRERIIFIVRPGELGLRNPIHQIRRPDGRVTLWICKPS